MFGKAAVFLAITFLFLFSLFPTLPAGEVTRNTSQRVAGLFATLRQDEASLIAFLHAMPKGADLRVRPAKADMEELRTIFTRAVNQRLAYIELVASLQPTSWYEAAEQVRREVMAESARQGVLWELEAGYLIETSLNVQDSRLLEAFTEAARLAADPGNPVVGVSLAAGGMDWAGGNLVAKLAVVDEIWAGLFQRHLEDPAGNPAPLRIVIRTGDHATPPAHYESIRNRNILAIELGHASRLGGGGTIAWEDHPLALLLRLKDERIAVEVYPESGQVAEASLDKNPFGLLLRFIKPPPLAV